MVAAIKPLVDTNRIELHNSAPLGSPLVLYVEASGFCNLKCKYCPHYTSPEELIKNNMTLEMFKKVADDMKELGGIKLLRFCGTGETLLNKKFIEMAKYAKESKASDRIEVITNGVLINERLSTEMPKYLDRVIVSIEGLDDQGYSDFAGSKVDFDKLVGNIAMLHENSGSCKIHVKIHNHAASNKEEIERFFRIFRPICDEVYVENLVSMWPEVAPDASNLGIDAGYRFGGEITPRKVCVQIFKSMLVNANGDVVPCCVDFKRVNMIGNVEKETLMEIWNGKLMRDLQLRHLQGLKNQTRPCVDCTMNDYGDPDNIDAYADEILDRIYNLPQSVGGHVTKLAV